MPEWLIEVRLPSVVCGGLLIMWITIPAPEGEADFASRLRDRFRK